MTNTELAPPRVVVIPTGVANLASVLAALGRAGAKTSVADSPVAVERATHIVLPGVGSFGAAMVALKKHNLIGPLRRRIDAGRPTLAICLGMQILFDSSEESPEVAGLCCVRGIVTRFNGDVRIPQLGWNRVEPERDDRSVQAGSVYFANSFRIATAPGDGWSAAFADHGGRFVAAIERDGVLACQFHPELSGSFGQELVTRWLAQPGTMRRLVNDPKRSASC